MEAMTASVSARVDIHGLYGGNFDLSDRIYSGTRGSVSYKRSVFFKIYIHQCIAVSGYGQHGQHDSACTFICSAAGNLFCSLSCGICQKRKPACGDRQDYCGNSFRNSIHCIWTVWYAVLCDHIKMGTVHFIGSCNTGDYDSAGCDENQRGGIKICPGFFQGRKLRAWSGEIEDCLSDRASVCSARHFVGSNIGSGKNRGRDGGTDVKQLNAGTEIEGLHINQSYATAVVLLVVVIIINAVSTFIAKRITKG